MTILDVYENDLGEKIYKVETFNGTKIIEGHLDFEENLEYIVYGYENNDKIKIDTKGLTSRELDEKYNNTLLEIVNKRSTYEKNE